MSLVGEARPRPEEEDHRWPAARGACRVAADVRERSMCGLDSGMSALLLPDQ